MIIAEYCEKIGQHELQAAHAEEERRILRKELWRQQMDFREVHQQSLTEMEALNQFAVEIPTLPVDQCLSQHIRYLKGC